MRSEPRAGVDLLPGPKGAPKLVRYWLMEPIEGDFEPHGGVDELRWVTRPEADELLTYDHDRSLVRKAMRRQRWRRLLRRGRGR